MIYKVIFRQIICFQSGETVYICMNYISLFKERSFIMTAIYSVIINVIMDFKTLKIVMFTNPTDKTLKVIKEVRLNIIYECVNTIYIIIDMFRTFIILVIITAATFSIEPFTPI